MGLIVRLRLELSAVGQRIDLTGKVVWSVDDKAGFRLLDIEPAARAAIAEFLSHPGASSEALRPGGNR